MAINTTRTHILKAANLLVLREGVARLTIEAVAHEAGLSKGGVLYHYPSKEALIAGMVAFLLEDFDQDVQQLITQEAPGPGRWLRAYIRASSEDQFANDAYASLLAAISTNPQLLEPMRQCYRIWQQQTEQDGLPPALATVLRLAADGLWFADLFGLATPTGQQRQEIIQTLLDLTNQSH